MKTRRGLGVAGLLVALLHPGSARADSEIVLDGAAPEGGLDHFFLPFEVPPGIAEIEVQHLGTTQGNVLDFGLNDPQGFRGWGGGNKEPAVVGLSAASRSYLAGPLPTGTWQVVVGKADVFAVPARFSVKVILRETATLPPDTRKPYSAGPPLAVGERWYAGDFHTHSRDSGDARPSLDELATFARSRGLDFAEVSDHNTVSQLDFFNDAQAAHPDFLLVPGIEYTTYQGHGNAIGATRWVDHKIGQPGATVAAAIDAVHANQALFGINHPALELGDNCIGCAWRHDVDAAKIDTVEVSTGKADVLFGDATIAFWEKLIDAGSHAAAIGGSDDHKAGLNEDALGSPIGDPTTMVFARDLSVAAILEGVHAGRTVVKLLGPTSAMVDLTSSVPPKAGSSRIVSASSIVTARVTGGIGRSLRFVADGVPGEPVEITTDPFESTFAVAVPALEPPGGEPKERRVRAEVLKGQKRETLTSYLFFRATEATGGAGGSGGSGPAVTPAPGPDDGCTVSSPGAPAALVTALAALLATVTRLARRRR